MKARELRGRGWFLHGFYFEAAAVRPEDDAAVQVGARDFHAGFFQRSQGVLQRVPDLSIQSVRLEILEGDTVRASQDADLNRVVPERAGVLP